MSGNGTSVAVVPERGIRSYLQGAGFRAAVAKLHGGNDKLADRFARVCLTQTQTMPALARCDPTSIGSCLLQIAEMGLEPGRDAYLIPRGDVCTLIVRWEGYVRAARASGEIKRIWAETVHEGDEYEITGGSEVPSIRHRWRLDQERGPIIGAYACAEWRDGVIETLVVGRDYLDRVRACSQSGAAWKNWPDQMSKRSVMKRLCKGLPLGRSDQLQAVASIDHDDDEGPALEDGSPAPAVTAIDRAKALLAPPAPEPAATKPAAPKPCRICRSPDDREGGWTGGMSPRRAHLACVAEEERRSEERDPDTGEVVPPA